MDLSNNVMFIQPITGKDVLCVLQELYPIIDHKKIVPDKRLVRALPAPSPVYFPQFETFIP